MSNKVIKMRSALRSFGIMVLLFSLIGCGAEPPAPIPVEQPAEPPRIRVLERTSNREFHLNQARHQLVNNI